MACKTLAEELYEKRPKLCTRAKKSPLPAIRVFCLTCLGLSQKEVQGCTAKDCPLYPFRLGRRPSSGKKREVSPALTAARESFQAKRRASRVTPPSPTKPATDPLLLAASLLKK